MPIFRGTIYKQYNGLGIGDANGWTNVYNVEAADTVFALGFMQSIADLEKTVHASSVVFPRVSVKGIDGSTEYASQSVGGSGDRTAPSERPLPLYCTARILIGSAVGRPESKYYRLPFYEGDVNGDIIEDTLAGLLQDLAESLAGFTAYLGPLNEVHTYGTANIKVQMRQLGWRRRTRPGQHRGWVDN